MATAASARAASKRPARPAGPYARVAEVLGESALHMSSPVEVHARISKGLPRQAAVYLVQHLDHITLDEGIRALNISPRTWQRIKSDQPKKLLDSQQSARVWSLAEVLAKAEDVLGSRAEAEQWLARPAIGLDSHRPIDLMATPQGAELVKTLLEQLEHGVYA